MKPTIGRIVHFVNTNGRHLPAIITKVFSDTCINIQIFSDELGHTNEIKTSCVYDEGADMFNTWHWPERE